MSMIKPSQDILDELDTLLDLYLRLYPDDRPLNTERYLAWLETKASKKAYAYVKRASRSVELIRA